MLAGFSHRPVHYMPAQYTLLFIGVIDFKLF
jgi:hypothetical protein